MAFDSTEQAYCDLEIFIDGNLIVGLRGLTDETTSEDELLYAAGNEPFSIQTGNYSYKGSVSVLFSQMNKLNDGAKAAGYKDLLRIRNLVIVATYAPVGINTLRTRRYTGVKFNKLGLADKQGQKFIETELPFLCTGLADFPN